MKKLIFISLALLNICLLTAKASEKVTKTDYVLLLASISFNEVWSSQFLETISKEFNNRLPLYSENLMVPAMQNAEQAANVRQYLSQKYEHPPHLVVYVGDPGWIATRELFDQQWKNVPVIICNSRNMVPRSVASLVSPTKGMDSLVRKTEMVKGYNVTTIDLSFFIKETIDMMRQLMPQMRKIAFIHDRRYISLSARKELEEVAAAEFPTLELEYLVSPDITSEELLETVSKYDDSVGLIYYSWFTPSTHIDGQSKFMNDHLNKVLFGFTNTPIFTLADQKPDSGNFAGGYYVSNKNMCRVVTKQINNILNGNSLQANFQFQAQQATKYLNYEHLQFHNVDPTLYPSDAIYFEAPLTFFTKYKVRIIGTISVAIIVLIVGGFWLFYNIQKQRQRKREHKLAKQYRRMVENMPIPYLRKLKIMGDKDKVLDTEIIDMNPACEHLFGCQRDSIVGKRLSKIEVRPNVSYTIHPKPNQGYDLSLVDENNITSYYDQMEFSDTEPNVIDIFFINKTDAYQSQLNAEQYRTFLQSILDNLPLATKVNNLDDNLNCIYWNKQSQDMFDNVNTTFNKQDYPDCFDDNMKYISTEDVATLRQDGSWRGVRQYILGDGRVHSLMITKHLIKYTNGDNWVLSSAIDISEIQHNRQELEYLNNKYKLVLCSAKLTILEWNLIEDTIYCNTEYTTEESGDNQNQFTQSAKNYFDRVHPDDAFRVNEAFRQLISREITAFSDEYRLLNTTSGKYRWIKGYAVIGQCDAHGKIQTIVGASQDVNEHKLIEVELLRAKEKADESNRLKSAFLANMSHEIRTPLNAIVGFSSILTTTDDPQEKQEYSKIIENNNNLLLQLISDILDLSKIEAGSLEFIFSDVVLDDLYKEIYQNATLHKVNQNLTICLDEPLPPITITSEQNRLRQVLNNLIVNAIKFTTEGTITLGYRLQSDNMIYFYVRDTGCGISPQDIEKVFKRFIKLNNFVQGTGLGLSICETIIERLGGKIGVDSELGVGSTFWFTLPNILKIKKNLEPV